MTKISAMALAVLLSAVPIYGQSAGGEVRGRVTDETGGALPGVTIQLRNNDAQVAQTETAATGDYAFSRIVPGKYQLIFSLINFAVLNRRDVNVGASGTTRVDAMMHLSMSADITVVGKRTFANLADVDNPAENLVGVAESASQGAITARQLDVRPIMRQGEVLETVPGVIITQHSGEGKANQYFLRGFNLDHGSDFAQAIAGTPVNMPTHAHSQGYSDINFLIPELVAGVQFSKGPYFADQGDFATAGASNINYATSLDRSIVHAETGNYGFGRVLLAASPKLRNGHLLAAMEVSSNSGPWTVPDKYRKYNGVLRYSQGNSVNGFSLTFMGYHGSWNATEASPERAIDAGLIGRFGSIDQTDGGRSSRYSLSTEWQRGTNRALTKLDAYALAYRLNLISNFTFYLDDPVHGDQIEQVDRRLVTGAKISHRRIADWAGRSMQSTFGAQIRNDRIPEVALYHTERRQRLETRSNDSAFVTSAGLFAQNELAWTRWFRTTAGIRGDVTHFDVDAQIPPNGGTASAGIVSPKISATFGPWARTEFYVNAGTGFHSNNAIGVALKEDAQGNAAERATPLVRAKGAEVGIRTVAISRLQSTVSLWTLRLESELVYNGDIGATEPGPASARHGVEIANYYSPSNWVMLDGDVSLSTARFIHASDPGAAYVPEAVGTVISAGVSVMDVRRVSGSVRLRYFGSRALVEDNSVRSDPTTLVNAGLMYELTKTLRLTADVFNLFDAKVSDIDYYFASRLPGEPLGGVDDIHSHPAVPRTFRAGLQLGF